MFDSTSRYANLEVKTLPVPDPDGGEPRQLRYVGRRFVPPAGSGVPLLEHGVREGDRLDNVAARYLGDPTQFWRIADANQAVRPEDLTARPGARIAINLPEK